MGLMCICPEAWTDRHFLRDVPLEQRIVFAAKRVPAYQIAAITFFFDATFIPYGEHSILLCFLLRLAKHFAREITGRKMILNDD